MTPCSFCQNENVLCVILLCLTKTTNLLHCPIPKQGMAVGYASAGGTAIGEIQFGDYIL